MMGRIIGGVIGTAISRQKRNNPVAGAVIGAGAMFVARRIFPARYAALAATAAAAYVTKKWADRNLSDPRTDGATGTVNPATNAGITTGTTRGTTTGPAAKIGTEKSATAASTQPMATTPPPANSSAS
jgi:hypothetical protein